MPMQRRHKPNIQNCKTGGNPEPTISAMSHNAEQLEKAKSEQYGQIAIAICTNPDSVNELSIMDLIRIHRTLYNFAHPVVAPNLVVLAVGIIMTRLQELERTTGLNFGINAPEMAEIESSKAFLKEACKNAIARFNESDYWEYP